MSRAGGAATLSGVAYQVLYTAFRFAEAITEEGIVSLCAEAHHDVLPILVDGPIFLAQKPAIDDLLVVHQCGLTEYISLKYRGSHATWDVKQLRDRGIWADFLKQHEQQPDARLLLVTQTPIDPTLALCLERAKTATLDLLEHDLGPAASKLFNTIEEILRMLATSDITRAAVLRFLQQVELIIAPATYLEELLLLRLRPYTADATVAKNILLALALRAGAGSLEFTPNHIRAELTEQGQPLILPAAAAEVMTQLQVVSTTLTAVPATIGVAPPHHIARPELYDLLEWIRTPLPTRQPGQTDSALRSRVIIGGAGVGKTVLLRDLCLAAQTLHMPVLGLKADRTKGKSKGELLQEIQLTGLQHPLQPALATVATPERPAVVIIDQLDALSMCLSIDHSYLNSYTELIADLAQLPNVRLVLSCRTFDLQHDPELELIRQAPQIEVPLLSLAQVGAALQAAQVAPTLAGLAPVLQELLRVPLHLYLYCALDDEARGGAPISSVQGLYERLIDHFLINRTRLPAGIDAGRIKSYLTNMAQAMQKGQTLTLAKFLYKDADEEAFQYLSSRGILAETGRAGQQVTFFHQSFYEYLFARHFVLSGQPLAGFVLQSGQDLYQRSLVQQVLSYLRNVDITAYGTALQQLLSGERCRTHIKLLLTQYLASQSQPYDEERSIAHAHILTDALLLPAFLEVVCGRAWLSWLVTPTIFYLLVPAPIPLDHGPGGHAIFWRLAQYAPDLALQQVHALPDSTYKLDWIRQVLSTIKAFDHALFPSLFEQAFTAETLMQQQFWFWHILKDASATLPEWVARKTYEQLAHWPDLTRADAQHEDHMQSETFKSLYKASPAVCFALCSSLLRTWIKDANQARNPDFVFYRSKYPLITPPYFLHRMDRDLPEPHNAPEAVRHYIETFLAEQATLPASPYHKLLAKWLHSRQEILFRHALAAVAASPAVFITPLVRLFSKPGWLAMASRRGWIGYTALTLFPAIWDAASLEQRSQLAAALLSNDTLIEERYDENGQRKVLKQFGFVTQRFLLALTTHRLSGFTKLEELHKQLSGKWSNIPNEKPRPSGRVVTGGDPSPAEHWKIEAITSACWLKALRKYRNKPNDFWQRGGTYDGLCRQLGELIKSSPADWQPLLQHLLDKQDESVERLLPAFYRAAPTLAAPLIDQALQVGLLTAEVVRHLRRHEVDTAGKKVEALPTDIRADLAEIRTKLDSLPTSFNDKEEPELLMQALRAPGGSAVYNLLSEKLPVEVVLEVVELLHTIAVQGSLYVRAAAVHYVALLLNAQVPPEQVVALFLKLVGTDYQLLAPGLWSLQYLIWRDKDAFLRLFSHALATEQARKPITKLLTVQWGHNEPGAYELLVQLWEIDPNLRATSLNQLREGSEDWPDKQLLFSTFSRFLSGPLTDKMRRSYDSLFVHLPVEDFDRVYPLLPPYLAICASDTGREYHFVVEYLAKNIKYHPVKCIAALDTLFSQIPVTRSYFAAKKALEVLIEAYTRLPHHALGNADAEAALDLFDKLLARPDCRTDLDKALSQVQSAR
ncbi:MAG: NACHT domain-containing protein [Janthinobacterium lividum]